MCLPHHLTRSVWSCFYLRSHCPLLPSACTFLFSSYFAVFGMFMGCSLGAAGVQPSANDSTEVRPGSDQADQNSVRPRGSYKNGGQGYTNIARCSGQSWFQH